MSMRNKASVGKTAEALHSEFKPLQLQQKQKRVNRGIWLNLTSCGQGTRICEYDHPYSTYGFNEIIVWIPRYQQWFSCGSKTVCVEGPMNLAIREFYDRWNAYTTKRFGLSNIQIQKPE